MRENAAVLETMVRYRDGKVDDIVIDANLVCIEPLVDNKRQIRVYRGNKSICFEMSPDTSGGELLCTILTDELEAVDDTRTHQ